MNIEMTPWQVANIDSAKIVCVLGMHRSGTSLLMRLLSFIGVALGPAERLQGATPANPTGYWEHREIRGINDEILGRLGGSWRDPPLFPNQWETLADFDDLRARAVAIVERDFASARTWGFKDPRTCLTLPFWRGLFPNMRYVLCIRNPTEVALSIEHSPHVEYEGISRLHALQLWSTYVAASIASTSGMRREYVRYDDLIARPGEELDRLAVDLGLQDTPVSDQARSAVVGFVRPELRHHHRDAAHNDTDLPDASRELLSALLSSQRNERLLDYLALRILTVG